MKLHSRIATIAASAATAVVITAGAAHAQDGGLLSLLDNASTSLLNTPSLTLACFPAGQVGQGNTFKGTQNISCNQSATQSNPAPTPGTNGVTGQEVVQNSVDVSPGGIMQVDALCPAGKVPTGGGFNTSGPSMVILSSTPLSQGWRAIGQNNSTTSLPLSVVVVCVNGTAT
ncbi:hypothetical protein ACFV23_21405 [Streptomyces sp. NPDC059627]